MTIPFPGGNVSDTPIIFPFTAVDLTAGVDILPNQWGMIGDTGIFEAEGTDSTLVEIDYRDGFVTILSTAERGTIPQGDSGDQESALFFKIPHFPDMDKITPKDLENRFAFQAGSGMARRRLTLEDVVARKLQKIKLKHDVTKEFLRMGAIKGNITDGKGNVIYNLFTAFGITQQVFNFTFSDDTFDVREFTYQIARYLELNLHGDVMDGIEALVSPEFFDALTSHPNVKAFFLQNPTAKGFQGDLRKGFTFGSITFREYNAQVPTKPLGGVLQQQTQGMGNMTRFIESGAGYAFPAGTRDTFREYNGPAYTVYNVYKEGVPVFVSPEVLKHGKGIEIYHESNPLPLCRRPNVLAKLTFS